MKQFFLWSLIWILPFLWSCDENSAQVGGERARTPRPNIILLVAEDLSPRIGAYGDLVAHTPNIDRLAKESLLFTNVFTTAGVCAPSRAALITGVHQQTLGAMHMRSSAFGVMTREGHPYEAVIPAHVKAFPELMRASGYVTINDDKTDYQFGNPFTVWDKSEKGAASMLHDQKQPFFAMINFFTSHEGYTWPPDDQYDHPLAKRTRARNKKFDEKKTHHTDPASVTVPPYYPDLGSIRENIARHYDNIAETDKKIGEYLRYLEQSGLLDNSIVIFTTDHGDGLPRAKRSLYDSGLKTPLLIRFPDGRLKGVMRDDLISFVDLAPTILALADIPVPAWMQGRIILGDQRGGDPAFVFAASDRQGESAGRLKAVRSHRYKYIRNYQPGGPRLPWVAYQDVNPIMQALRRLYSDGELSPTQAQFFTSPSPYEEFYDLENDPYEVKTIIDKAETADILQAHRNAMDEWIASSGDLSTQSELAMVADMWPDAVQPVTSAPLGCRTKNRAIKLTAMTAGASIGYQILNGEQNDRWLLYVNPIEKEKISVKSIRYGFKESSRVEYDVKMLAKCVDM